MSDQTDVLDDHGFAPNAPKAGVIPTTDIKPGDIVAFKSDRDGMRLLVSTVSHPFASCEYRQDGRTRMTDAYVADLVVIETADGRAIRKAQAASAEAAELEARRQAFIAEQAQLVAAQAAEFVERTKAQNAAMVQALTPYITAGVTVAPSNLEAFKL